MKDNNRNSIDHINNLIDQRKAIDAAIELEKDKLIKHIYEELDVKNGEVFKDRYGCDSRLLNITLNETSGLIHTSVRYSRVDENFKIISQFRKMVCSLDDFLKGRSPKGDRLCVDVKRGGSLNNVFELSL